ncbi:MAG: hypothetical protein WAN14_09765 [Candidatus Acidiferrales bacterium]
MKVPDSVKGQRIEPTLALGGVESFIVNPFEKTEGEEVCVAGGRLKCEKVWATLPQRSQEFRSGAARRVDDRPAPKR